MDNDEVYKAILLRKELGGMPHLAHLNALAEANLNRLNLSAKAEAERMVADRKKAEEAEVNRLAKEEFDRAHAAKMTSVPSVPITPAPRPNFDAPEKPVITPRTIDNG